TSVQGKIPAGAVILGVMLSSDQTALTGNNNFKAWPLYCKLANTPMATRNKANNRASRVLAWFPVLDEPKGRRRPWWSASSNSTIPMRGPKDMIYQCTPALAAFIGDLPEQRLMAGVKSGNTVYSCPRC
ncbi:hypothetical protein BCR43DRAFT_406815, partial [Syncephalastrum racemosum]